MSGRSRSKKSSRGKSRGKARAKARVRPAPDDAARDLDPPQCPELREESTEGEETKEAQVQAGAGRGGLETAAPALPRRRWEEGACQLPPDCGLALRARAAGGSGQGAPRADLERVPPLSERLERDTVFVGTVGTVARPKNGPRVGNRRGIARKKAPETCCRAGRGPQAIVGGLVKKGTTGECASASVMEEKKVENGAGPGPQAAGGSMGTLESVQLKLETMNAQADRAYLRLSRKFGRLRLYHLERRNLLIQNIPGFWVQVFQNHPQLSSFLSNQDKEVLCYMNRLEVEELGLARLGYKIKFYFVSNPYFQNKVLIKEYGCGPLGQVMCRSTPIQWLPGHDLQSLSEGNTDNSCSFFAWFSNHSSIESDKIVEIINEDLWPNPLQYYFTNEGALGEKGKEVRRSPAKQAVEFPGVNQHN
ncbi:testis-specific Y-encoded-like protein 5 [Loxodonta africana]|uniref:TSPY like 5 n=1 Tax=Loxodonta africana TaxID=9785 RepID=G3UM31_LOXAF|nr:testis-specific Y-encoded-like protein 5 [Loxodonta africana]XP_049709847.1 testis-specific Y-encoded-like protein 5 [Elephas maximus indicus]